MAVFSSFETEDLQIDEYPSSQDKEGTEKKNNHYNEFVLWKYFYSFPHMNFEKK